MTLEEIDVLEASLQHLRREPVSAAQLFYCRLFTRRPQMRRMFGGSPDLDGQRLLSALDAVRAALADPRRLCGLDPFFAEQSDCIEALDDAMQWMLLNHGLGHPLPVREAWQVAYRRLSDVVATRRTVERIAPATPAARRARPKGSRAASARRSVPPPPSRNGRRGGSQPGSRTRR
jgi:hemoglobin-like flavoprotein